MSHHVTFDNLACFQKNFGHTRVHVYIIYVHVHVYFQVGSNSPPSPSPQVKCCGVDSFRDYMELFDNETVPESCCNKSTTAAPGTAECEFFRNVTNETLDGNYIYVEVGGGVRG